MTEEEKDKYLDQAEQRQTRVEQLALEAELDGDENAAAYAREFLIENEMFVEYVKAFMAGRKAK